jgi:hypothetical protein
VLGVLPLLIALPRPPTVDCPWTLGTSEVLTVGATLIPRNASFWIHTYGRDDHAVEDTFGTLSVERVTTELTASGGRLIELRPSELLLANRSYLVRPPDDLYGVRFTTTATIDETAPDTPIILHAGPIISAYEVCETAGIVLNFRAPAEFVIHVVEDVSGGGVLEVGVGFDRVAIPTEPGATQMLRVFAMDLAGNRSAPTEPMLVTAGRMPASVDARPGDASSGCAAGGGDSAGSAWLALVLLPFLLRVRPNRHSHRSSPRV